MKEKQNKSKNKIFELLIDNSPKIYKEYEPEAAILDKQINTPNVNNIAIVAKYGAGKSSLIATYLDRYRNKSLIKIIKDKISKVIYKKNSNVDQNVIREEKTEKDSNYSFVEKNKSITRFEYEKNKKKHKYLNKSTAKLAKNNKYVRVSLSTFNDNDFEESEIEQSVLQQLLYSRKKEKFPNSEIVRTNKTSIWRPIFLSFIIVFWICSIVLFALDVSGVKLIDKYWTTYAYAATFVVTLFVLIFIGIRYHKLKKIDYKNIEVEFSQNDNKAKDNNLINKFINEILYYFECVKVNLVIFEDLDRLQTTEIFVKLHELNTIINNCRKRYGKVTFLYAVKDELFKTEEERAKFFEFILPITPVINPMTTKVEIENRINQIIKIKSNMVLSSKFIKGISLYIPDMRVLNNVFNDYIIMFSKIMEDEKVSPYLENEKLFALCAYKNLFPYDYAMLEKNSGLIPSIINLDYLKEKYAKSLEEQKNIINSRIENAKKEALNSFEELRAVFIEGVRKKPYSNYNSNLVKINQITTFENLTYNNIEHPNHSSYGIQIEPYVKDIVDKNGIKFLDRERQIKDKETEQLNKLKGEMSDINMKLQQIANYTMNEIVRKNNVDFYLEKELLDNYKIKLNKESKNQKNDSERRFEEQISYLKFLLINNYIDEHYIEYTSSYQSDIITTADIQVAKNIQIKNIDFNAKIVDSIGLVKWLDDEDFSKESIIIKQLLLKIEDINKLSHEENDNKFNNLISLLSDNKKTLVIDLLNSYFETTDEIDYKSLLKYLLPYRPSLLAELIVLGKLEKRKLDSILVHTINFVLDYTYVDNNKVVKNYISNNDQYLFVFEKVNAKEKIKNFLEIIVPKFDIINNIDKDNEIQQYIIENSYYKIKLGNLQEILIHKCGVSLEDFQTKNYTTLKESEFDWLNDYIENNINQYVKEILLNEQFTLSNEREEQIALLLKNKNLDIKLKKALVEKINFKFDKLDDLDIELLPLIFEFYKVVANWDNIHYAYNKKGFECVCSFIRDSEKIDGNFYKTENYDEAKIINLLNEILIKQDVKSILKISRCIEKTFDVKQLNYKEIPDENLSALISCGKINYSNNDFLNLIEKEKSLTEYIKLYNNEIDKNFDEFLSKYIYRFVTKQRNYYDYFKVKQIFENGQLLISKIIRLNGINLQLKNKLIGECKDIISIKGYETIYKDYIINERQSVPSNILWQFIDAKDIVSDDDRKTILTICFKEINISKDKDKLQSYLNSLDARWNILKDNKLEIRVNDTIENNNLWKVLEQNNLITMRKSRKKGTNDLIIKSKVGIA